MEQILWCFSSHEQPYYFPRFCHAKIHELPLFCCSSAIQGASTAHKAPPLCSFLFGSIDYTASIYKIVCLTAQDLYHFWYITVGNRTMSEEQHIVAS